MELDSLTNDAPKIEAHVVHLLYVCDRSTWEEGFHNPPFREIGEKLSEFQERGSAYETISSDETELLWTLTNKNKASRDLLPNVNRLISGSDRDRAEVYEIHPSLRQKNGRFDGLVRANKANQLEGSFLQLSQRASSRLRAAGIEREEIELFLGDPVLYRFRTGVTILDWRVTFGRNGVSAEEILEAVSALSRINKIVWRRSDGSSTPAFALGALARLLINLKEPKSRPDSRVFTSAAVLVDSNDDPQNAEKYAICLAKRYTNDYRIGASDQVRAVVLNPFLGTYRVASPEGAAVVITNSGIEFEQGYLKGVFESTYLPLCILALHEQAAWSTLADDAARWHDLTSNVCGTKHLEITRYKAQQLRAAFSMARSSNIADHDEWRTSLEHEMHIPALRQALAEDLVQTDAVLQLESVKRHERRVRWIAISAGALAAGLSGFTIINELFQTLNGKKWIWSANIDFNSILSPPSVLSLIGLLTTTALAVVFLNIRLKR